jgi:hypothetical protein
MPATQPMPNPTTKPNSQALADSKISSLNAKAPMNIDPLFNRRSGPRYGHLRAAIGDKKLELPRKVLRNIPRHPLCTILPDKVGRMVLDGAVDPNISILEQNISQAKGFDEAFGAFIADCAMKMTAHYHQMQKKR